ncbi:MAG: hypothetical protein IJB97_03255, partial [Clostridia bacterium]|nr:hypothetical protein [Clostridia bacterium]
MNNKKNLTKLTNDRLKSSKWLLTVSAALSALVNLVTLVALLIGGVDFEYWIVPLVLTLVDGAFLAAVLVSNYRFGYAHTQPVYYTVLTLAGAIWTFLANGIVDETLAYTTFSSYTWLILHGVSCFAVLLSAWKAAKFGEDGKKFGEWAALAVVALVATTGVCGYFSFKDGVFGQGSLMETRALEFSYDDENGYYRVVGLVKGRGKTVSVPKEFNGEKVGAIDCSVLDDKSVKIVRFADATVVLEKPELLVTDRTENRVIYVDKSECDLFRERFFKMAYEGSSEAYLRVANAVAPEGLDEDEIYVTFTYDLGDLQAVNGKTLDTWYGQKGESVDFAAVATDAEYVQKNDPNNADHLYWSYDNLGKKMYKGVEADGVLTDGKNLDGSAQNLTVVFEPLYAVNVAADNDGRYELADSFRYGEYNGRQRSRIVTKATADEWLGSVASRDGFTLAWKYGGSKTPFTSLAAVVSDDLTVYPEWTMSAPTIEILATDKPNGAIYGDTVTFFATASAPNPSLSLRYEWTNKNSTVSNERDWDFSNVYPEDSGEYTLTVTAYSDTLTTLTSEASDSVEITVGKKALGFTWTLPSDLTYSATDKTVLAAHNASDVINGDLITFDLSLSKVREIGNYNSTVSLTEACADLYFVKPADQTVGFTVLPYEISVNWADTALTYNGDNQKPTASATGLGADGALPLTVTGEQKNAGEDYTASVTTSNENYKIANFTQTFAIAKATVEMVWTKTSLTYNGYAQKPEAKAAGLGSDGDLVANVSGEMKDVGTDYIATATLNATDAKNYQISTESASHTFLISKVTIGVAWTNISLTYSGESQLPTASVKGLGEDKALEIVSLVKLSSGDGINAGNHEATASTTNGNYVISNATESFTIRKKTVDVVWTDLAFTYDGAAHKPTASVTGVDKDGALDVTVSGERVNAGKGTATATLETQWTANYELKTATVNKSFTINKKAVTLVWQSEREFVYDGAAKNISVIEVQGLIPSDSHDEILGGVTYVAAVERKTVGQYSRTAKLPDDGNYVIETGATQSYTIAHREISFVWDSDLTFTYGEDLTGKAFVKSV